MNKAKEIADWRRKELFAADLEEVASQLLQAATRLKSEAQTAQMEIGASPERRRKVPKAELPADQKLAIKARMLRKKEVVIKTQVQTSPARA